MSNRFQVGDRVRVTPTYPVSSYHGLVGKVIRDDHSDILPYLVRLDEPYELHHFDPSEIESV